MRPTVSGQDVGVFARFQAHDVDRGLELGNLSVGVLARVRRSARDYVREFTAAPLNGAAEAAT